MTETEERREPDIETQPAQGNTQADPDCDEKAAEPACNNDTPDPDGLTIVAIGASAGGLDPLKTFIETLPEDSGMAFVVVQHLAPDSPSMLAELLAAKTAMPVVQVNEEIVVEEDHVYVIAPKTYLAYRDGKLCTSIPPEQARLKLPTDFLFRSLAEEAGASSAGIVLSGTGSDGTLGVSAIRGACGLTIAQEPSTAQYADMPKHAIATGLVDLVLPVEKMAAALLQHFRHPYLRDASKPERDLEKDTRKLDAVLDLLREHSRSDFRWYRRSTLMRRIARRMGIVNAESLESYTHKLEEDDEEAAALVRDLLIGVTSFFRDTKAFEELNELVIRPMVREKARSAPLRVWIAGCGSGEEAYSIAMLLFEAMEAEGKKLKIQIFATDLDARSLQTAREGHYPLSIVEDVSRPRLERFFVLGEDSYQIKQGLREAIVFAVHNLVADPPFCHIDLISCRNLLIYVEPEVQAKIISLFHFTLAEDAYLFLGKSESAASRTELFKAVSNDSRIMRRLDAPRRVDIELPVYAGGGMQTLVKREQRAQWHQQGFDNILKSVILSHFGAAAVLMDGSGEIIRFFGRLDRYLNVSSSDGGPQLNMLEMARESLSDCLAPAVRDAVNTREPQAVSRVPLKQEGNDDVFYADVTVLSVAHPDNSDVLVAVVLERSRELLSGITVADESGETSTVEHLQRELRLTQEDLRHTIDALQSGNEELKVANEEATSMNEEMQSTNEELETSKEELQSINEELTSVNSELHEKLAELHETNNDMSNLLNSTAIATLFIDSDLNVRFFTPLAGELLNLRAVDKGRPIAHLAHNLTDLDLAAEASTVQASTESVRREVRDRHGRWYMMQLLPYEDSSGEPDGVVITFTDISELKLAEKKTRRLAAVMTASNDAVLLVTAKGQIQEWNRGAEKMYGWTAEEALRKSLFDLTPADCRDSAEQLLDELSQGETVHSFETQRLCKGGRIIDVWLTASTLSTSTDEPVIALTERDLTEHKRQTRALQERADQLQKLTSELVLAEQRERRRLASVLHDHLQQLLVGAKFGLVVLARHAEGETKEALGQVDNLLDQAITASRSLSVELSPPILHEAGLAAGLEWLGRWMAEKHGLKVTIHADESVSTNREDVRLLVFQSVRELLFNVVKHAKVTAAEVEMARHDEKQMRVTVADDGVGFDAEQAFAFGDSQGGMGLHSIRERMTMMGGSCEVESAPGEGTRFTLLAPLAPKSTAAARQPRKVATRLTPPAAEALEETIADGKAIRVLLVDDHQMVRHGLALILADTGEIAVVGQAADGVEALRKAHALNPDIVLMDVSIPKLNGIEATRRLRQELPHIQVIGVSMEQGPDQATAMEKAGAAAYISKCDASDILVETILQVYSTAATT